MKKRFIYSLALAAVVGQAFTSCKSDDPEYPGDALTEKTYADELLKVTLNGDQLLGKSVTFTPDGKGKANIILQGATLNLSEIIGMIGGAETAAENDAQPSLEVPTAGVLPGSASVTIPVELSGDAGNCTFSGSGETDYCTFNYTGSATDANLEFNLSDVKLKNVSLAGTWTVGDFEGTNNFYTLARVVWKSEKGVELFPGWEMPIETIASMTLLMPMLAPDEEGNPTMNCLQMLQASLKDVTFAEDGTLTARYVDSKTGQEMTAPAGVAQYVVDGEGQLRLFLNPAAIIANTVKMAAKTRAADMTMLIEGLMTQVLPMLTNGVPVHFGNAIVDAEGNTTTDLTAFYLGTETLLPLFKTIAPLFEDEEFVQSLVDAASQDPAMGSMAGMLPGILNSLPGIIDTTTQLEIGINLQK